MKAKTVLVQSTTLGEPERLGLPAHIPFAAATDIMPGGWGAVSRMPAG